MCCFSSSNSVNDFNAGSAYHRTQLNATANASSQRTGNLTTISRANVPNYIANYVVKDITQLSRLRTSVPYQSVPKAFVNSIQDAQDLIVYNLIDAVGEMIVQCFNQSDILPKVKNMLDGNDAVSERNLKILLNVKALSLLANIDGQLKYLNENIGSSDLSIQAWKNCSKNYSTVINKSELNDQTLLTPAKFVLKLSNNISRRLTPSKLN